MRRCKLLLIPLLVLALLCPCAPAALAEAQASSIVWQFDPADISVDGVDTLTTVSVSPSGQYIIAVDRGQMDKKAHNAADVANSMGRLANAIYLFSRQGEHYRLDATFPIDREAQLELSSIVGAGCAIAWSEDESRVVVAADWSSQGPALMSCGMFHTNLYLLELSDGAFRRLTENSQPGEHSVLPQWIGNDTLRYVRSTCDQEWKNTLVEINVDTGNESSLANLYNAGGAASPVICWQAVGERIYYTADSVSANSGFFTTPIGGTEADARCLLNVLADLKETNKHPYCSSTALYHMEISADNRWACLSILDMRVLTRDFPLSDHPQYPQDDPANAVSAKNGRPWVPCHNVLLYDLEAEQFVDPFADPTLDPAKVIVSGACFSPDGQSLLCALFGDGGPWRMEDDTRATFCLIDLSDGSFTPVRLFETQLAYSLWFPRGFRWLASNVLCIPTDAPPTSPVQMFQPAALG